MMAVTIRTLKKPKIKIANTKTFIYYKSFTIIVKMAINFHLLPGL